LIINLIVNAIRWGIIINIVILTTGGGGFRVGKKNLQEAEESQGKIFENS
jgi:hypothetical protein